MVRSKPSRTGAPPRVGEGDVAEADLARRQPGRPTRAPPGSAPAGAIAALQAQHRGHRRGRAVEGPVEPAEGDHRGAHRRLGVGDGGAELDAAAARRRGQRPEDQRGWRRLTSSRLDSSDRSRSRVASYCSRCRRVRRSTKRSMVQPARPNRRSSLAAGRIDGEAIGVVGVALRAAHLVGVAVAPDGALAQQPVGRQPAAGEHQRRPPGEGEQHHRRSDAAEQLYQAAGDEVHGDRQRRPGHAEVEVAGDGQVIGERLGPRGGPCRAAARRRR